MIKLVVMPLLAMMVGLALLFPGGSAADDPPPRTGLVRDFNHYFINAPSQQNRLFEAKFLGMPIYQNPTDMWVMQEIITELYHFYS